MIYDLFSNVVDAANALHVDKEFSKNITIAKDKLYPLKKGKYGQLQEWVADVDNPRDHHRHIAHLYGMYPGNMISYTYTPEWANAVKKALENLEIVGLIPEETGLLLGESRYGLDCMRGIQLCIFSTG